MYIYIYSIKVLELIFLMAIIKLIITECFGLMDLHQLDTIFQLGNEPL